MSLQGDNAMSLSMGQKGFTYLSSGGTTSTTERIIAIFCIADATVSATSVVGDSLTSVDITQGMTILGQFSEVSVSAGSVLAYRGTDSSQV